MCVAVIPSLDCIPLLLVSIAIIPSLQKFLLLLCILYLGYGSLFFLLKTATVSPVSVIYSNMNAGI